MAKDKIIPEWIQEEYFLPLSKLKSSFGLKGMSLDDVRITDKDIKGKIVLGVMLTTRRYKKDIEEEEKIIPDGIDSARG